MRMGTLLTCAVVLAASACAHSGAAPNLPGVERSLASTGSAIAPQGRIFDARLDTNLDAARAEPGDPVQAHLEEPLLAEDGSVIAPRGTPLVGRVISAGQEGGSRISIQLDGMLIRGQVYAIDSRVIWVESARVSHPEPASPDSTVANVYPNVAPATGPLPEAVGGGPPPETPPLRLNRGTKLQLQLERPFSLANGPKIETNFE